MTSDETTRVDAARRILDAASELLYTRGINSVGVDLLARTAGVTKKTIYDRFGSKEAVIAAYLAERRDRWHAMLEDEIERAVPEDRPLAPFDALAKWQAREPRRGCAFVNALVELPEGEADSAREIAKAEKAFMQRRFAELVRERGGSADPDAVGRQLFLLHEGASVVRALEIGDEATGEARQTARTLVESQSA